MNIIILNKMSTNEPTIFKSEAPDPTLEKTKTDSSYKFTPIETNKVQQQELSKTVYSRISTLHTLISNWKKNRDKGFRLARAIDALNLAQYDEDYFPSELKPLMDSLGEIVDALNNIVEEIKVLNNQLQALAKLQPSNEPVLMTWSVSRISEDVAKLYKETKKECELVQNVIENMAHCRDEHILGVYLATWRPGPYVRPELYAYLFSEAGLAPM